MKVCASEIFSSSSTQLCVAKNRVSTESQPSASPCAFLLKTDSFNSHIERQINPTRSASRLISAGALDSSLLVAYDRDNGSFRNGRNSIFQKLLCESKDILSSIAFCAIVMSMTAVVAAHAQTVSVQSNGSTKVSIKNGRIRTKGDVVIGSGNAVARSIPCKSIHSVVSEGSMDIAWVYADEPSVVIEGDDNIVDLYRVYTGGSTVRLDASRSFVSNLRIRVTVYSPSFRRLVMNGAGDAYIEDCKSNEFSIEMNGSGNVRISGSVNILRLRVSGSGEVDASRCSAKSVNLRMQGSGDVQVYCTDRVSGSMHGAGDLTVHGGGAVNVSNDGAGDVYH